VHEIGNRLRVEAEALLGDHGNEACTGFEIRIVELPVALVLLKMGRIVRTQERALVVVEPPGNLGRTRVLEIDDGVLVASEVFLVEERACAVQQATVFKIDVTADALAVKPSEERGGGGSVEAFVVKENPDSQVVPS
jgi:hypothetical protein